MRHICTNTAIHRTFAAGVFLFAIGSAMAQDNYPKGEFAPQFMYIYTSPVLGAKSGFNCVGGGGTISYNFSSVVGVAADLGGCTGLGLNNSYGIGSRVGGDAFTWLFGPRITFRHWGKVQPFFNLYWGGMTASVSCNGGNAGNACGALSVAQPLPLPSTVIHPVLTNPSATSFSRTAFAMSVGGGMDYKINKTFAVRLFQAEYLFTRFGNSCQFAICNNNGNNNNTNSQNSFRLESGVVIGWGRKQ
jgi:opacity protein-like surface antigen